jgi:uncharacterized membrane protein YkvA (DUF1232 family)
MKKTESELSIHYSERSFWGKLGASAAKAGKKAVAHALELYYTMHEPETPAWAKSVILGALGYFILPADAVPDMLPAVGFTDDLGVLAAALATVEMHITPEIRSRAAEKLSQWFGSRSDAS